jgi:hypothetical protein
VAFGMTRPYCGGAWQCKNATVKGPRADLPWQMTLLAYFATRCVASRTRIWVLAMIFPAAVDLPVSPSRAAELSPSCRCSRGRGRRCRRRPPGWLAGRSVRGRWRSVPVTSWVRGVVMRISPGRTERRGGRGSPRRSWPRRRPGDAGWHDAPARRLEPVLGRSPRPHRYRGATAARRRPVPRQPGDRRGQQADHRRRPLRQPGRAIRARHARGQALRMLISR